MREGRTSVKYFLSTYFLFKKKELGILVVHSSFKSTFLIALVYTHGNKKNLYVKSIEQKKSIPISFLGHCKIEKEKNCR